MDKREETILIWVLSCAGIILLLLYSPWGSPDLYTHKVYFAENLGVNFSASGIKNSPKSYHVNDYKNVEIEVEDYYAKRNKQAHSSANASGNYSSNRIIALNKVTNSVSGGIRSINTSDNQIRNNNGGGNSSSFTVSGLTSGSSGKSGKSKSGNSGLAGSGMTATSVDLSLFGDSTAVNVSDSAQKVEVDPSGDPIGPPVPIPEGWSFLLSLAGIYVIIKLKLFGNLVSKFQHKSI